jgi:demethylmenaquinone methyltransferase/2-methoxy-6-polyprenyl-1,4-benzoquinol methylase
LKLEKDIMDTESLIKEQIDFYRELAGDYDGQVYDQEHWENLANTIMKDCPHVGSCLEMASGSGLWTKRLLDYADSITAVDSSPEMHAISVDRISDPRVSRVTADIFNLELPGTYDLVFAAFWLSHVPMERFEAFWGLIAKSLKPNGRVLIVDSHAVGPGGGGDTHHLTDGREFTIIKVNHDLAELGKRLDTLGWDVDVVATTSNTYRVLGTFK